VGLTVERLAGTAAGGNQNRRGATNRSKGRTRSLSWLLGRRGRTGGGQAGAARLVFLAEHIVLALVALVPQLLAEPGVVESDTKSYLYIDPGRFILQSASMWDPGVALGTVTHEQIGYLLPMGPFFWLVHALGVPLWIGQRVWVAAILFFAGAGVIFLARTIGLVGPGRFVAAFAFMLSPYFLQYVGRMSVVLLPWAGLPWMIALIVRALRNGGWRDPALFAIVVALVGGINASSLLYVGLAPVIWLPYSVLVSKEHTWKEVWSVFWKVGLLTVLVSLWWAAGLQIEAAYGVDILKYTETVPAVSETSTASEVLRGLGYWYFYGGGRLGPWVVTSVQLTQELWVLGFSFAVPALSFLAATIARWRHRAFFVIIIVVGMVFAVGANPFSHPSPVGHLLEEFMTKTTAGLAMRSTDRASPLVILGTAMLLGAGISAIGRARRKLGLVSALVVLAVIGAADPPVWNGTTVANDFTQPSPLPAYEYQVAKALDAGNPSTRVYAMPGENFAAYRFGDTIDPIYPGLLTRPFVTREQQVMGSLPTQDVLYAIDAPMQQGTWDLKALPGMLRLISAGDLLIQNNLAYERYGIANPREMALALAKLPSGLGKPVPYGTPRPNVSLIPNVDEQYLSTPPDLPWPAPLEVVPVRDPRPILRTESIKDALVVDGNAQGIAEAAAVGLLRDNPTVLYAATLLEHPKQLASAMAGGAAIVLTDTNAKQGFNWNTLAANAGYTETAAQKKDTYDPTDAPLNIFPGAPPDAQTTAVLHGVASVTASSYGNSVTYTPEDQPIMAIDGNLNTAWVTGAFGFPVGQWWQVTASSPVTTNHVNLVQPIHGNPDRWITKVTLTFDGRHPVTVSLGPASRTAAGQTIHFSERTFRTFRITIDAVSQSQLHHTGGLSAVGFAEVRLAGIQASKTLALPEDLLRALGPSSLSHRLTIIMTRRRVAPYPPRTDPERELSRSFWLPTARTFTLSGTARVSALIPDDMIDRLMGRPGSNGSGIVAYSRGRLPGDLQDTASAALEAGGGSSTMWSPGFGASHQIGDWIEVNLPHPVSFDHLDLQVVADGYHSVPTSLSISAGGRTVNVKLPPIADARQRDASVSVPVFFPELTGSRIRVTVTGVRDEHTRDYYSSFPITMPLGIAKLGIPGVQEPPDPAELPGTCTPSLLTIDGKPVWLKVVGSTKAALLGDGLHVETCGPDANGVTLGPGYHWVQSSDGHDTGFNIDRVVMSSAPGGAADVPASQSGRLLPLIVPRAPGTTVDSLGTTFAKVTVTGATQPFWLVLGESINQGWTASVQGGPSLGRPTLVDGFANGWLVDPAKLARYETSAHGHAGSLVFDITWTPQTRVWWALVISGAALLACLLVAVWPRRWRRTRRAAHAPRGPDRGATPLADVPIDATPLLGSPLAFEGRSPTFARALVIAAATGFVAGFFTAPLTGVAVGIATATALLLKEGRAILTVGSVLLVGGAGLYVVLHQASGHFIAGGFWPAQFSLAATMTWMGVVFLGADAVIEVGRRVRRQRREPGVRAGGRTSRGARRLLRRAP
jgi:arabinofuranan 3-O-arabinosyltransferase